MDDIADDGFLVFRNPFLNPKDDDGMALTLLYRSFRSDDSVRYVVAAAVAAATAAAASIDRCFVPMDSARYVVAAAVAAACWQWLC